MLRLMLLRHAKSSWTDPERDDRDRPLSGRGANAATAMGAFMRKKRLIPDVVLCSPARRAGDTWKLVAKTLKAAPKLILDDALYDFGDGGRLLDSLRQKGDDAKCVLLICHNPAVDSMRLIFIAKRDESIKEVIG